MQTAFTLPMPSFRLKKRFVARLPGKNDSFSRWRRFTIACGDIIRTRIRRTLVLLPAIHRAKKGVKIFHIKSQANN
jgi:hypothetical protein